MNDVVAENGDGTIRIKTAGIYMVSFDIESDPISEADQEWYRKYDAETMTPFVEEMQKL